jgi:hypothetical protein
MRNGVCVCVCMRDVIQLRSFIGMVCSSEINNSSNSRKDWKQKQVKVFIGEENRNFFFFCWYGVWTQDFALARQALARLAWAMPLALEISFFKLAYINSTKEWNLILMIALYVHLQCYLLTEMTIFFLLNSTVSTLQGISTCQMCVWNGLLFIGVNPHLGDCFAHWQTD